ncbi:nucleoside triphosphate pyrophosphohydrolase [Deinococcus ficus]|uniref:Phosphoribosyl-ATP pyrophosphohydrolase n=1 Tax=Deinococcus ficus TaxID=317577 RepID=A0A221SXL1_9DEIO|nr:nucleoside triphosphate pyrophosphohydrolase [Deinococcus ficus]ASN81370.1 hypothetical protein DFI_10410 [Deinococcus ficus]
MVQYNKLVRDRIPEIIERSGQSCTTEVLDADAYLQALLEKLGEEAAEVQAASPEERASELADVLEVLDAIMQATGLSEETVRGVQQEKRATRGGFQQRLFLRDVREG